jgi:hypothetical protein
MAIKKARLNQRLEKKRKERWGSSSSSSSSSSGPGPSSSSTRSADGTGGEPDEHSAPFDGPRDQEEDEDIATLEMDEQKTSLTMDKSLIIEAWARYRPSSKDNSPTNKG